MKALVKIRAEGGLWLEEVPIPEPGPNEVLIEIQKTAICGTDLHIYEWNEWAQNTISVPMVIGHEFAGKIAAVGANVGGYKEGDVVSGEGHITCGHCRNCLAGRRHLCCHTQGVGVNRSGAFAEYLCLPVSNVWPAHSFVPTDILSFFDPLGNATHTALSFDLVGEDVLITGAGPIGLMACAIAKHVGARYVVVTDMIPYRLELARKMGATLALNAKTERLEDAMLQLGMTEGFDVGMEMSGSGAAFRSMLSVMHHGGRIALLGLLPRDVGVDWNAVIFKGLVIKGIYGREMFETWYKMTSMLQSGLDVARVLTHRFHYAEYHKGFEVMRAGLCGKVVLNWKEESPCSTQ
jgi:threonine 3-dehydrogenase